MCVSGPCWTRTHGPGPEFKFGARGRRSNLCYPIEMERNGRSAHFFLDCSDSSRTLVRRHTGAHCQLPQTRKVIEIDRFLSSIVSGNIVALGGMEGGGVGASEATPLGEWKGVCTVLGMLRDGYKVNAVFLSFILSTTLFQITYTFRFLLGFRVFWDSQVCPYLRVRSGRVRKCTSSPLIAGPE